MSTFKYTIYDPSNGLFLLQCRRSYLPDGSMPDLSKVHYLLGWYDSEKEYYDIENEVVKPRPVFPFHEKDKVSLKVNEVLSLHDVPNGTEVYMDGKSYIVDDGVFEWSSPVPFNTSLHISCPPYVSKVIEVEVNEA